MPKTLEGKYQPPPPGATIDRTKSFARGMTAAWVFNAGGQAVADALGITQPVLVNTVPLVAASSAGPGIPGNVDLQGGSITTPLGPILSPVTTASIFWFGSVTGSGVYVGVPNLVGLITTGSAFVIWTLERTNDTNLAISLNDNAVFTRVFFTNAIITANYGKPVTYLAVLDPSSVRLYRDGVDLGGHGTGIATGFTYQPTLALYINRHATVTSAHPSVMTSAVYLWNRTVTVPEATALAADPYAPFAPVQPNRRFWYLSATAPAVARPVVSSQAVRRASLY